MDIGVPIDVKKFIDKEISKGVRRQIVPLIQQAYELVDASIKDISFTMGFREKAYRISRQYSAQFTLYEATNKGILTLQLKLYLIKQISLSCRTANRKCSYYNK